MDHYDNLTKTSLCSIILCILNAPNRQRTGTSKNKAKHIGKDKFGAERSDSLFVYIFEGAQRYGRIVDKRHIFSKSKALLNLAKTLVLNATSISKRE